MTKSKVGLAFCSFFVCLIVNVSGLVSHFKLGECMNISQEVGRITSLTLDPYPPQLPGNLTVSASIQLFKPVKGNITAKVEIRRKLGFLGYALSIPCISKIGTCTYTDVCAMISGRDLTTTPPPTTTTALPTTVAVTTSIPVKDTLSVSGNPVSNNPVTSNPVSTNPVTSHPVSGNSLVTDTAVTTGPAPSEVPVTVTRVVTSEASSDATAAIKASVSTAAPIETSSVATKVPTSSEASPTQTAPVSFATSNEAIKVTSDVSTTEASGPLVGRRDLDGAGDFVTGTQASMDVSTSSQANSQSTAESHGQVSQEGPLAISQSVKASTEGKVDVPTSTPSSPSTPKAKETDFTDVPAIQTSQPVQTAAVTTAAPTDTAAPAQSSTAATQTQEPVKDTTLNIEQSSTGQPTVTKTEPPTTNMEGTDEPVTQSVTDVSGEPSTTSFMEGISITPEKPKCPAVLADNNIPCQCPFEAGIYTIPPTLFEIPDLGALSSLAKGDYQVSVNFYDGKTGDRLMCQLAELSITQGTTEECHGLGCIFGR